MKYAEKLAVFVVLMFLAAIVFGIGLAQALQQNLVTSNEGIGCMATSFLFAMIATFVYKKDHPNA